MSSYVHNYCLLKGCMPVLTVGAALVILGSRLYIYIRTEVFCEGLLVLHVSIRKRASAAVVVKPRETPWYTYLSNV